MDVEGNSVATIDSTADYDAVTVSDTYGGASVQASVVYHTPWM